MYQDIKWARGILLDSILESFQLKYWERQGIVEIE